MTGMILHVLFYDDGDDGPDELIGIYHDRATAESQIVPHAKRYGNGADYQHYVKGFYIEERELE